MNIAVFLPDYHAQRLAQYLPKHSGVEYFFRTYTTLEELTTEFLACKERADAFLFSGLLSYTHLKEQLLKVDQPVTYLKLTDAEFYKKLLLIKLQHPSLDFSRVLLDFNEESESISKFIQSLPLNQRPITPSGELIVSRSIYQEGIEQHIQFHKENKVDYSFTRLVNILPELERNNIPHYYFELSQESIEQQTNQLIEAVHLKKLEDNQIVIGYLNCQIENPALMESELLFMHSLLLKYQHQFRHILTIDRENNRFQLTTNAALLQEMTDCYSSCALNSFLSEHFTNTFHIGWGLGDTYRQAEIHSKRALEHANNQVVSTTFICQDGQHMIGPLRRRDEINDQKIIKRWMEPSHMKELRKKVTLSEDRFNKLILAFHETGSEELSSAEFAEALKINVRSANRILSEAEKEQLVVSRFEKSSGFQGRPRKIYSLNQDFLNK